MPVIDLAGLGGHKNPFTFPVVSKAAIISSYETNKCISLMESMQPG